MNALIIEDESLIAKELVRKIEAIAPDLKIMSILPSLKVARKWFLENAEPDILFMDIQLSDGVSFELFETYELKCPIIFTTAYDEYAIRAFKVNGVDYLLKPIDDDELQKAIAKCRAIHANESAYPRAIQQLIQSFTCPQASTPRYKEKFIVQQRNQWLLINTKDIACFYRENLNYIFTFSGDKYILDFTTLEEIEELLNPHLYYRANRQFIIHIDAIHSVTPKENSKLVVLPKAPMKLEIDVSREKAPAFKKWFDR